VVSRRLTGRGDTFAGYRSISDKDGASQFVTEGAYAVAPNYLPHLEAVLECHEVENPMAQIRKYELVAGDVTRTVPEYFRRHPECVVALAYLDMQLYEPTRAALTHLVPRMPQGAVLAFDELDNPAWPGETLALLDSLGVGRLRLERLDFDPYVAFAQLE